ncbi:hypothetical protein BST97_01955 [Nonlabens spongiae]|uniref:Uncharacterized protein n=1 Tax=Nonlabens spongiae TaxID=331648 RepID=A0A1W6MGX5_9FLAO|nr:hypothetical protein BST97_01955 [Nonlabens spongiae]
MYEFIYTSVFTSEFGFNMILLSLGNIVIEVFLIIKTLFFSFLGFVFLVMLTYCILNDTKRKNVNREIIKLIKAIRGTG